VPELVALVIVIIAAFAFLLGGRRGAARLLGSVARSVSGTLSCLLVAGLAVMFVCMGLRSVFIGKGQAPQPARGQPSASTSRGHEGTGARTARTSTGEELGLSLSGLAYPLLAIRDEAGYRARLATGFLAGAPGREPYFEGKVHLGDDLKAPEGEPVFSIARGRVLYAGQFEGFGPGWSKGGAVVVDHAEAGKPLWVVYGHLKDLRLSAGNEVRAGSLLGRIGPWDHGTHLHLGIRFTPPPASGWGLADVDRVVHDDAVDPLGWQDPAQVLHLPR